MIQQMGALFRMQFNPMDLVGKLDEILPIIRQVNEQFRDPVIISFGNISWWFGDRLPYCQPFVFRVKLHSFVSVSPSSFRSSKRSDWFKSWPSSTLTSTTLLWINCFSHRLMLTEMNRVHARCVLLVASFKRSTWIRQVTKPSFTLFNKNMPYSSEHAFHLVSAM